MGKIKKDDSIFIAGARGLAGSAVHRKLKSFGYSKLLVPNRKILNLENYSDVKNWFEIYNPSVVILCAAKVGGILANQNYPADFILKNLKIQNNIIELSWLNNVKRFIFLGSSCIYPKYTSQPISEESLLTGKLEETNSAYAIAKIAGIELCKSLRKQYSFDSICLMPTNLYGPGDNYDIESSHVLASLIRKFLEARINGKKEVICWGTGKTKREFLHSDDLGGAVVHLMENWNPDNQKLTKNKECNYSSIINVGTGEEISIKELSELISELVGFRGDIVWDTSKPDGTPRKLLDISKIKGTGWMPTIDLREGIKKTLLDFETNYLSSSF